MGKTALCIRMLELLNTGRIFKVTELASLLETNPRNIVEYKKELEEAGYFITSIPGRYGGYKLDQKSIIPILKFSNIEKDALHEGFQYILSRNDFLKKNSFELAISKIYSSCIVNDDSNGITVINRFPLAMPEDELKKRFDIIQQCIQSKTSLKFKQLSQKNTERDYVFDPYELFMYNNAWFMIGWNQQRGDISYFKINRMIEYEKTNVKFNVWKLYNRSNYLNEYGFANNGEWYHIEFKTYGTYASLVKERIYGKNQKVIPIDEKTTLVKVDMQNKENIKVFILGFGDNCEIIEPQWLKEEIIETIKKILERT